MAKKKEILEVEYSGQLAIHQTECCGIYEISGLDVPVNNIIADVHDELGDRRRLGMIIFHDALSEGNGEKLAKKIRAKKLGKVVTTPATENLNTGRMIRLWVWYPYWNRILQYVDGLEVREPCGWDCECPLCR